VRALLLNRSLGGDGVSAPERSPGIARLLFEIPSTEFAAFSQTADAADMRVQIHGVLADGSEIHPIVTIQQVDHPDVPQSFTKLVLFRGPNRFGDRDLANCTGLKITTAHPEKNPPFPCGGDSWSVPTVASFAAGVQGVTWNDFSNMNGGFYPPHVSHRSGVDIDGDYPGYRNRDGAAALKMLDYLQQYGRKIDLVFVAYSITQCDPTKNPAAQGFWCAIKDVVLPDGRTARSVIQPESDHVRHFHWRLNPEYLQQ
jgi:hypothetical protein